MRNAYYLQNVVHSVYLIYVARLYGVLPCSLCLLKDQREVKHATAVKKEKKSLFRDLFKVRRRFI